MNRLGALTDTFRGIAAARRCQRHCVLLKELAAALSMRLFGWICVGMAVLVAAAASLWRLSPILPEKDSKNAAVCFAGDFDPPHPVHLQSFGYDMRRGRFKQEQTASVKMMRVEIARPADEPETSKADGTRSKDWSYILSMEAVLADGERLSTSASCPWGDVWVDRINPLLACFIDCEGGSVSAWRQAGRNALTVRFEQREHLRMHGCGTPAFTWERITSRKAFRSSTCHRSVVRISADRLPPSDVRESFHTHVWLSGPCTANWQLASVWRHTPRISGCKLLRS